MFRFPILTAIVAVTLSSSVLATPVVFHSPDSSISGRPHDDNPYVNFAVLVEPANANNMGLKPYNGAFGIDFYNLDGLTIDDRNNPLSSDPLTGFEFNVNFHYSTGAGALNINQQFELDNSDLKLEANQHGATFFSGGVPGTAEGTPGQESFFIPVYAQAVRPIRHSYLRVSSAKLTFSTPEGTTVTVAEKTGFQPMTGDMVFIGTNGDHSAPYATNQVPKGVDPTNPVTATPFIRVGLYVPHWLFFDSGLQGRSYGLNFLNLRSPDRIVISFHRISKTDWENDNLQNTLGQIPGGTANEIVITPEAVAGLDILKSYDFPEDKIIWDVVGANDAGPIGNRYTNRYVLRADFEFTSGNTPQTISQYIKLESGVSAQNFLKTWYYSEAMPDLFKNVVPMIRTIGGRHN